MAKKNAVSNGARQNGKAAKAAPKVFDASKRRLVTAK
jgi:hypothetical protein